MVEERRERKWVVEERRGEERGCGGGENWRGKGWWRRGGVERKGVVEEGRRGVERSGNGG